ncbi:hypothetical protein LFYK43_12420 [Ligilactobacillus salitolerans]|uniref:Uncharacterized protein n=1 Tax=Ligilactobacillus salitolerans TaxID=1808352 RepID=A0A401ITA9_9LACO|nr:hypothetical protein [Ligilactobacillus salitolerans]GBG94783.1 hypothetical protein LFYK43_12420 [Ligilactobacillus salitolerans]
MRKSIFKASYQESTGLVTNKQLKLTPEGFQYMKFRKRIPMPLLVILLMAPATYMVGVVMPVAISDGENNFSHVMARYGTVFSNPIKIIIIIWIILSLLFLIQRKNYGVYVIDAFVTFLPFVLSVALAIFDLLFGVSVAGVGLVGSTVLVIAGVIYIFSAIFNMNQGIKASMYGTKKKVIPFKWYIFTTVVALVLTVASSLIFSPKEFNLLLYVISFGLLIVCALIAFLSEYMIRMFVAFYYFAKYGEQYKQKFKITDEQWYGPSKAKRLAKKKGKR